jgi:hypothetical protein
MAAACSQQHDDLFQADLAAQLLEPIGVIYINNPVSADFSVPEGLPSGFLVNTVSDPKADRGCAPNRRRHREKRRLSWCAPASRSEHSREDHRRRALAHDIHLRASFPKDASSSPVMRLI